MSMYFPITLFKYYIYRWKSSCICLKEPPRKPLSQHNNCKFCMGNSTFSTEPDCDDKVPYRIFLSIIEEDIKFPESNCHKTKNCCEINLNRENERQILETIGNDFTFVFRKIWDLLKGPLEDRSTCIIFIRQNYTNSDESDFILYVK
ncbi:uncharacterized protein LOC134261925 [Saccostrea cucullata]|uniref:uncharacterized protein LOC134261925 n=1 Tax=Saccostrea cuccullata TaxID=36930 RepID=UPI002ED3DD48